MPKAITTLVAALLSLGSLAGPALADTLALSPDLQQIQSKGQSSFDNHDYKTALAAWQTGLQTANQQNNPAAVAAFQFDVGKAQEKLRQYDDALTSLNAALAAHRALHDRTAEAADLEWIGNLQQAQAKNDDAATSYQQALAIFKEQNDGSGQADVLSAIGDLDDLVGKPDDAMTADKQALDLYRATGDKRGEAEVLRGIAILVANGGDYAAALPYLQQSLDSARASGDQYGVASSLELIGTVNQTIGHDDIALKDYALALPIFQAIGSGSQQAHVLNDMAFSYRNLGRSADEERSSQQALQLARSIDDRRNQAIALGNLGDLAYLQNRFDTALDDFKQQATLQHAIGWRTGEAGALSQLADLERQLRHYDTSLDDAQQALALYRAVHYRHGEASALVVLASVLNSLGRSEEALQDASAAAAISHTIGDKRGEADALLTVAISEEDLHRYDDAIRGFRAALEIAKAASDTDKAAGIYYALGVTYGNTGHAQQAYDSDHQALVLFRANQDVNGEGMALIDIATADVALGRNQAALQTARQATAMARQGQSSERLWGSLRAQAKAEAALDMRTAAIADFTGALDQIESTRAGLGASERTTYFSTKLGLYDEFIEYLWQLNGRFPGKGYDRRALQVLERKQAREALEQIGRSAARRFAGVPESVVSADNEAELAVDNARTNLTYAEAVPKPDPATVAAATQQLHDLTAKRSALQAQLKTKYPRYYALQHPSPIDSTTLQKHVINPGELLLIYDVADARTLLWVVGHDQFQLVTLPGTAQIQQRVTALRAHTAKIQADVDKQMLPSQISDDAAQDLPGFATDSYALYGVLVPNAIKPLVQNAKTLVVIPSGPLYDLPWEALVTQDPAHANGRPHYLIQQHAISYIPSASLLGVVRAGMAGRHQAADPLLALARPAIGTAVVAVATDTDTLRDRANARDARDRRRFRARPGRSVPGPAGCPDRSRRRARRARRSARQHSQRRQRIAFEPARAQRRRPAHALSLFLVRDPRGVAGSDPGPHPTRARVGAPRDRRRIPDDGRHLRTHAQRRLRHVIRMQHRRRTARSGRGHQRFDESISLRRHACDVGHAVGSRRSSRAQTHAGIFRKSQSRIFARRKSQTRETRAHQRFRRALRASVLMGADHRVRRRRYGKV